MMRTTKMLLSAFLVLTVALTTLGASPAYAQKTIFDVDLTQGNAGTGVVTGGAWENGWRVTNKLTDRIVFDAGYKIADGYIETTLTINNSNPLPFLRDEKINYFGGYEDPHLRQGNSGDKIYLRAGRSNYKFSRPKGAGGPITLPNTVIEGLPVPVFEHPDIGSIVPWINSSDDITELTMKIEWKDGDQVKFFTSGGDVTAPTSVMQDFPIDEIRYGFIGGDKTYNISFVGARFLRFKMVDYNAVPDLLGDFDEDSDVDSSDFLTWQRGLDSSYTASDLANWEMNFGSTGGSIAAIVPEPATIALLPIGCSLLAWGRTRRCRLRTRVETREPRAILSCKARRFLKD